VAFAAPERGRLRTEKARQLCFGLMEGISMKLTNVFTMALCSAPFLLLLGTAHSQQAAAANAVDPGIRVDPAGSPSAGAPLTNLSTGELDFFNDGKADFSEAEGVGDGLGPRFNLDGCVGCHSQPATGGTAPATNPQVAIATAFGAQNTVPSFITANGPIREARFIFGPNGALDGGVHALFVVSGRSDSTGSAANCHVTQENFAAQVNNNNVVFRIPTPTFGAGLMELIPDSQLVANAAANAAQKSNLGIFGAFNHISANANNNGNDGTIARFGWKAQNKSMLLFAGEAYNVEMGISNELFQTEREENAACQFAALPNDVTSTDLADSGPAVISAIEKFAFFMRFLGPPKPSTTVPGGSASITRGKQRFIDTGCNLCHTPSFTTGNSTVAALRNRTVNLYSDLQVHEMGPGLADGVSQGQAGPDEFRSAPLWGLGQRIFLLHDGRTKDLRTAINAHFSTGNSLFPPSEANGVIARFANLSEADKQDLFNFLRSL
jgi:CxxC motif-containing protein (DUF1111 family)